MKKSLQTILAAAAIAFSANGHAAVTTTTIDFSDAWEVMFFEETFTTQGYTFSINDWDYNFFTDYGNGSLTMAFSGCSSASCVPGTRVTLTGTAPFSLNSIDAASRGGQLNFAGRTSTGKAIDGSIAFDSYEWKTYAPDYFKDLSSIELFWTGTGIGEIDNLVLVSGSEDAPQATDVPEPATLALIGAALLGIGAARRRAV